MARQTSRGLYVWDLSTDSFNHVQLAANWDLVDSYLASFDSTSKKVRQIHQTTTVPTGGTAGDIAMLTATDGGYAPYTIFRNDGANWRPIGFERLAAVPTLGNFAGRTVMLTAASSPFNAYDLIRYDGATWAIVGGLYNASTGGGALNISGMSTSGDIYFTNGNRGVVFTDRTTGNKFRMYVDNGNVMLEKVT